MRLAPTLAVFLMVVAGCASPAETTLHPDPPARTYAALQHPFRGASLYLDRDSTAQRYETAQGAAWLGPITGTPQARWLNSAQDVAAVPRLAEDARQQGSLLVLVAYNLPNRGCTDHREGAPDPEAYQRWIGSLVKALGGTRAVVVMEPDAVPADCFDATRAATLRQAIGTLVDAGQYVYLDAGHSHWKSSGETAERLLAAGIEKAEGFAVNVSNRQTTDDSYRWGRELSDLVGDREFVIDTSRNGLGPPPDDPKDDKEWCNPAKQALGQRPSTAGDRPGLAALLWIKRPGESDGPCGGETTYFFAPRQARNLIVNAAWVDAPTRAAAGRSALG
ncbi:glycoside hydrolase family 6 protein [Asanoa iriomotensis]|uniref:Glucanase n=1 Tax=Asanoa iriomotensis TaxID=234613 RepID=A0ABQ4BXL6_9ACTN|nr:glycoside hydrolase family 6 protein [Asanoa iriomotensis]GIF55277.1 glucanase [Asanoa iriomotensis]